MPDVCHTKAGAVPPDNIVFMLAERGMALFQIWGITEDGSCRCPVGPDCRSPGKHPIHSGGLHEATSDRQKLLKMAAERPDAQWAIACQASDITVLDVDHRHAGAESLRAWKKKYGELPATLRVKTGNGFHLYFRRPAQGARNSVGKIGEGLDIRGDGGYVVAPGSKHTSGATYELEDDGFSIAQMPPALQLCTSTRGSRRPSASPSGPLIEEGHRNNALASLAGKLRRSGHDRDAIEAKLHSVNGAQCRPPLDEAEVRAIAKSIARYAPHEPDDCLEELARLPLLEYERRRKDEAVALGVTVSSLDKMVTAQRSTIAATAEEEALIPPVEPWPERVDGEALLEQLVETILKYVVIPRYAALSISLWILNTHVFNVFYFLPLLVAVSPDKRCGKTTLLAILARLVHRPLSTSNVSPAALYRVVEKYHPTLLVDEADTFLPNNEELRGIINSGHTKTSARVVRCQGEQFEPRSFSTWTPKFIAQIGKPPGTIRDRAIVVEMRRKKNREVVARLREDRVDELMVLQRQCLRWTQDNKDLLDDGDPTMPLGLNDRAEDNWRGLLTIAEHIGGPWPEQARIAAVKMQQARHVEDDDNMGVLLLRDIYEIWLGDGRDRIPTAYLLAALNDMEHRPWPEYGRLGAPLTAPQLAKLLAPFGIRPKTIRVGLGNGRGVLPKGYERQQFDDAFERYLHAPPGATPQPDRQFRENGDGGTTGSSHPTTSGRRENSNKNSPVAVLRQP